MQIFNLSTLEQFPNIFQVNMRAPPEAVRTQIQQLLVDRMVKKQHFCLVVVCPTALVVVCSTGLGLVIVQLVLLSTGLTVKKYCR